MAANQQQQTTKWPHGAKAAVSFTMDNLGEAQDVNRGLWPADRPVGTDASVREQLPRILDLLDRHGIRATYFAEAWSLGPYADVARRGILGRGHGKVGQGSHRTDRDGVRGFLSQDSEDLLVRRLLGGREVFVEGGILFRAGHAIFEQGFPRVRG